MRSPDVLPSYPEFRPELEPEQDLCLKSLLSRAETRARGDYDNLADSTLIEGLNDAVVDSNEDTGEYTMVCQRTDCEANCIMSVTGSGSNGSISVISPQGLQACAEEA